ncbi:MAG: T9SS type A sorting domain-containing protein [Cyclobacteriaceae bacterium]|nr:T9SS type A sorting domain-containing protein [Cyclobacteriaceae bacterium]MDW8331424.1 T9SS type A sorting domain-containing protein [Cyclobacteriaceae bacterium]
MKIFWPVLLIPVFAFGQLEVVPVQRNLQQRPLSARTASLPPMQLPFWDDFSKSNVTDTLWDSYNTVLVNSGMALNPPTINVASFDGLDATGTPYTIAPLETGFTDSLVSRKINLAAVPPAQRNKVFLSFFYQWGGFADTPDPSDYLMLEFKNNTGLWEPILTLYSDNTNQLPNVFYDTAIRINQSRFYHPGFQFRFRAFGRRSGRYDVWHIDYVYLNYRSPQEEGNTSISDRAMTRPFSSLLGKYYAVPYAHFRTNPGSNLTLPSFEVFNLKDTTFNQVLNYTTHFRISNFSSGTETITYDNFTEYETGIPSIPSRGRRTYSVALLPPVSSFNPTADSVFIRATIGINSGDNDQDYFSRYEPIDFLVNDTLSFSYRLTDYYAYDDGAAEYAAGLTQAGNMAAYRFETINAQPDTLSGVFIYYPFTAASSPNIATFMVWSAENGKPSSLLAEQTVPVRRNGQNVFTYFKLNPAVVVQDTFFIGWKQMPGGLIRIGLDSSNDTGNRMFVNTTGSWVMNDLVTGSLMMRPQFGKGDVITHTEKPQNSTVELFPNPSNGTFYLRGPVKEIEILTLSGQVVPFTYHTENDLTQVNAQITVPGIYLVRCKAPDKLHILKLLARP